MDQHRAEQGEELGNKDSFPQVAALQRFPLEGSWGARNWDVVGGPDCVTLSSLGVERGDQIVAGLNFGAGEKLFACGGIEGFQTASLMKVNYDLYASGRACSLSWYKLPQASTKEG